MDNLLRVLVVDDERPVLDELQFLLSTDPRVGDVLLAESGAQALALLESDHVDLVLLDIAMPDMSGLSVARVLAQFRAPPSIVFVTAHDDHAVEAFDLRAVDYVLKPVRADRLAEAVRRVVEARSEPEQPDELIPVELGGVTRFVARHEVRYVEAAGDYARLHTGGESHLVRVPLSRLARDWADSGFVRIHRSMLVASAYVREVRTEDGHCTLLVELDGGHVELQVARRQTHELRDLLVRHQRPAHRTA